METTDVVNIAVIKVMEKVLETLSFWKQLTSQEKNMITGRYSVRKFEKGQMINSSDTSCMGVVIILSGGIRVSLISDEGREITLYRLTEGEYCVTTASCVISQITFDTSVMAIEKTELLVIPSSVCSYLKDKNIYFKAFLFEVETERFSQAIWVIQEMLFKRFDQRLASYLISAYEDTKGKEITSTQEEIARDVNSAREVVARMLRHFAKEGLVEVKRGQIILLDVQGLRNIL